MNIKSVLRVYSQLRNLTDDETTLLETLRAFTDAEREAFVEALQPQKVVKKASKKSSSKSPRASGMAAAIKGNLDQRRAADSNDGNTPCGYVWPDQQTCVEPKSSRLHDPTAGYAGYHEYQPIASAATTGGN